jgi:hypothetical protein
LVLRVYDRPQCDLSSGILTLFLALQPAAILQNKPLPDRTNFLIEFRSSAKASGK